MNYKKIFKSRKLRLKLLEFLAFIPDKTMIRMQYKMKTGRKLDLNNPTRFTEKLQWYKLFYKNPLMIKCVDKYDVREYVKSKGYENILIPCLGIFENANEINFDKFPDKFVVKDTLGGGGAFVKIVDKKTMVDFDKLREKCATWLKLNAHIKSGGREWPYYTGKNHRIIVEKYIEPNDSDGLIDYKFFCFNGVCKFLYVLADRDLGEGVGLGVYDADFNRLNVQRVDERPLTRKIVKPENYMQMLKVAECLAQGFPEVRVDLYNVNLKIYFGELTFFDGSGYMSFSPDTFDEEMGKCFKLPE